MSIIISDKADMFFNENDITADEWGIFCRNNYILENKNLIYNIWYEGNKIGYSYRKR